MKLRLMTLATLTSIASAACDLPMGPEDDAQPTRVPTEQPLPDPTPQPTQPTDRDRDGIPDDRDRCPDQPENRNNVFDEDGCPDTPQDLFSMVATDVERFWGQYFQSVLGRQYVPVRVFRYFVGQVMTSCGPGSGPLYCPPDLGVFLDQTVMLDQLARNGDFAAAVIIAHEIGHHTQNLLGLLGGGPTIHTELQADCLAGAWAGNAASRGLLDPGDYEEAVRTMFEFGDAPGTPWFAAGAHGSPQQRRQAFERGFRYGAGRC